MASHPGHLLDHIRRLVAGPVRIADAVLLSRFVQIQDQEAFATLVARHGPMVYRLCRRVLSDAEAAEDVFQAAFFVLARKAATLRRPERLAGWLFGVAQRLALKARSAEHRRRAGETQKFLASARAAGDPLDEITAREALRILDEEIERLPEAYRLPVILCCVEGRTQEEAASQLGWTMGSLQGRLQRGRARLHRRLSGRGLELTAALGALELSRGIAAALPSVLANKTVEAAMLFAAGSTPSAAGISAQALALAEGAVKSIAVAKMKIGAVLVMVAGVAVAGVGFQLLPAEQPPEARQQARPGKEKDEPPKAKEGERQARTDLYTDPLPEGAISRLGNIRFRHGGWDAGLIAFSPDGATLLSADEDGVVHTWDAATGAELRRWTADPWHIVQGAAFSDGRSLATAGREGKRVDLLDVATGHRVRSFVGHDDLVWGVAFTPNGKLLVSGGSLSLRFWDANTGRELRRATAEFQGNMGFLAFSPDSRIVAATGGGNVIRRWEVATARELSVLPGHRARAHSLAFSHDGTVLATAGDIDADNAIRTWNIASGAPRKVFSGHMADIVCLRSSADGKTLISGDRNGIVRVWDARSGAQLRQFAPIQTSGEGIARVTSVFLSPDAKSASALVEVYRAASGVGEATAFAWDCATGRLLHERKGMPADASWPPFSAFSPDGRFLAVRSDHSVRVYELATGREALRLEGSRLHQWSASFSPDGTALAVVRMPWREVLFPRQVARSTIGIYQLATGREVLTLPFEGPGYFLAFSPDGRLLASEDRTPPAIRLWELATGQEVRRIKVAEASIASLAFSSAGKMLASGLMNGNVLVWDVFAPLDGTDRASQGLTSAKMERLWRQMAGADAVRAYEAGCTLIAAPRQAADWIKSQLHPASAGIAARIARLIGELDSDRFEVRQEASRELEKLGRAAHSAMRRALANGPSPEARRRLEALLNNTVVVRDGEELRGLRAVQVLEAIGTPDAKQVLESLVSGAPEARLTHEAKASLERLARLTAKSR